MKTIVRRDSDEDWKDYVRRLIHEEGVINDGEEPTDEALRRFDAKRKGKKFSNHDWKSKADDDARIVKTKDGRTHFGYKAEHTVDLETEVVLSATVQKDEALDTQTPASLDEQAERSEAGRARKSSSHTASEEQTDATAPQRACGTEFRSRVRDRRCSPVVASRTGENQQALFDGGHGSQADAKSVRQRQTSPGGGVFGSTQRTSRRHPPHPEIEVHSDCTHSIQVVKPHPHNAETHNTELDCPIRFFNTQISLRSGNQRYSRMSF